MSSLQCTVKGVWIWRIAWQLWFYQMIGLLVQFPVFHDVSLGKYPVQYH